MHNGKRGSPVLILDFIEPDWPKVDGIVLGFVAKHVFSGADFVIRENGGCRLSPQLAKHVSTVLAQAS